MTVEYVTLDEFIDRVLDARKESPPNERSLIDIIIEQLLEQRSSGTIANEFFESVS